MGVYIWNICILEKKEKTKHIYIYIVVHWCRNWLVLPLQAVLPQGVWSMGLGYAGKALLSLSPSFSSPRGSSLVSTWA